MTPIGYRMEAVLRWIGRREVSVTDVADAHGIARANAHETLRRLLRLGLVRRRAVPRAGKGRPGHVYSRTAAARGVL